MKKNDAVAKPASVSITRLTRDPIPRIAFTRMASHVLPSGYQLSLVIAGDALTQRLNRKHRSKSYTPNVLSFPLDPRSGEIFLNLKEARRQFDRGLVQGTWQSWVALLVIHSMLHLKGMAHGRRMEAYEDDLLRHFGYSAKLVD